jgi:hypothetical protein
MADGKKRGVAEGDDDVMEGGAMWPSKRSTPIPKAVLDEGDNDEDKEDWKTTLFYWRGELRLDAEKHQLVGGGPWVGRCASGLPSDEEFARSPNTFEQTAALGKHEALPKFAATIFKWPVIHFGEIAEGTENMWEGVKGSFKGSYLLDQGDGDGLQSYTDKSHSSHIYDTKHDIVTVVAQGSTEFGCFVSAGILEFGEREETPMTLTLARRYVESDDPRAKWTTENLAAQLKKDVGYQVIAGSRCPPLPTIYP